jgi:hypothetical protein
MNAIKDSVCNVCGKPATNGACDIQEIVTENGIRKYQISSNPIRFGCKKHPTKSITYDVCGNIESEEE